ncbi:MAG TPA: hypothetical protein PLJ78_04415 [Anaerolineae bacterium]|nr:hypothetical protein [Anaerolineae bacterium]HQK13176.1 hypothetical protein [Anaerolineae bacterium]
MTPYLSFVVAARNDNYGGNFLHRMQVFVNALLSLWDKHGLNAELVIVEWNPPKDRSRLEDALAWPKCLKPGTVRIVEVPSDIHYRFPNSDRMPMFEYIAKNVGIRRAKGEYVLATNPDLLYSEALVRFLASRRLAKDCFYRIDRYDVVESVPLDLPPEEQLRFCGRHVIKVATIDGTVPIQKFPYRVRRLVHSLLSSPRKILVRAEKPSPSEPRLHTNASGDFFLMARQHWHEVRGYPELKSHSFIDGYACFLATALGLQQVVLKTPLRIYHQEHDRSEHTKRPLTNYQQYLEHGKRMLEPGRLEVLNGEDWGLGYEQLPECWIRP